MCLTFENVQFVRQIKLTLGVNQSWHITVCLLSQAMTQLTATECGIIADAFKSKDFSTFVNDGVNAEGVRYQFLGEERGKVVFAKKEGAGALTLQASKTGNPLFI